MKRILFALGVGVALFAIVAFAAGLTVTGGGLQSGSGSAICDADGVVVKYQDLHSPPDFVLEQATVDGIGCSGTLMVSVQAVDTDPVTDVIVGAGSTGCSVVGSLATIPLTDYLTTADIADADINTVTIVQCGP